MLLGLALVIITGLLWGGVGILHSRVARGGLSFPGYGVATSVVSAAAAAVLYVRWTPLLGGAATRTGALAAVLGGSTLLGVLGFLLIQRAMRRGHQAGTWTVAQSAMVFPFLASVILWHDELSTARVVGFLAILAGVAAIGRGRAVIAGDHAARPGGRWFGLALMAFGLLGGQQVLTHVPNQWADWTDTANLRAAITFAAGALGYGVVTVWKRAWPGRREWLLALIGACIGLASQGCFFSGLDCLSAIDLGAIVYPTAIGVCILTFALYSLLVLGEPTSPYHWLGLACCIGGILVIAL